MFTDLDAREVEVPNMPEDLASVVGKGPAQGQEVSQSTQLRKYARRVDSALRAVMAGRSEPLVIAAAEPVSSVFRSESSYSHVAAEGIKTSPARLSAGELASRARPIIDGIHADSIAAFGKLYAGRAESGRAASNITDIARAATFGAVDTLIVDIDEVVPGTIDEETGVVTLAKDASGTTYGVIDEIAGRVLQNGGKVIGVRREDVPGDGALAAVLRYKV